MSKDFPLFAAAVHARFVAMSAGELLTVTDPDIFAAYLAAFPEGTNPIFRTRTEHDGSIDKHFIRNIGLCVQIVAGELRTVWEVNDLPHPYDVVAAKMADHVRSLPISGVFRTKEPSYGTKSNIAMLTDMVPFKDGVAPGWTIEGKEPVQRAHTFYHFHAPVARRHHAARPDEARGAINTTVQVFQRGLDTLSLAALDTVLDLIDTNSLYRGAEFRRAVAEFRDQLAAYQALNSDAARSLFAWANFDSPAARFRNTAIGTLVVDLSDGMPLEKAVRVFESKVAPQNYKRTSAPISTRMIEQALGTLADLGLETAIERRFARASDVSINDVLFADNTVRGTMKGGLAGLLATEVKAQPVNVDRAEPISIEAFMAAHLPLAKTLDLVVGNEHLPNFVSLTAPIHADAGRLFKWRNPFAWSYDGEVADSIKQRVKAAGGKIDAEVRASLSWSNFDDLDLHVMGPGGHIFYITRSGRCGGTLDVDMNAGHGSTREPVENIYWNRRMPDGVYRVAVNSYTKRENEDVGFAIEFESHGSVMTFVYPQAFRTGQTVEAFTFEVVAGRVVTITSGAAMKAGHASTLSQDKWGVKTAVLTPVDMLLASPNHWDGEVGIGNKHWLFMLRDCKNPEPARGIYNEFLRGDLEPHRKVFEVLGAKTKCPVTDDQLSGVGFSSTRQDKAVVVVNGKRAFQIHF